MTKAQITAVLDKVKAVSNLDAGLLSEAADAIRVVFPGAPVPLATGTETLEQVLHLVDLCLPGWTIQLTGKAREPDGQWRCSLRETRGSDEIEIVGLGAGPAAALALLEALLQVSRQKAAR